MKTKKQPLSVERIAACAVQLADKKGLEELSMRKIAEALHVEAMSLYHHVPSKAKLMEAMVEHMLLDLPSLEKKSDWPKVLTKAALQWRELALKHPGTFPLLATRAQLSPNLLERYSRLLETLTLAGFSSKKAAQTLNSFFFALNGYLLAALEPFVLREIPEPSEMPQTKFAVLNQIPATVWEFGSEKI